ncbi:MAG: pyridoxal phosphate-dependent aminotransferase family protein [Acidobacteria bacterium]|jgi:8-amino-7-oxononanoate synthase|nr:pyridoxal phosphate-dependent aminotransferase family protein [Acidobacteriota bacterium]
MELFHKCTTYTRVEESKSQDLYPYFKPFSSEQGPEVYYQGRKIIMIGSNNYLGLTNDPRLKEAAINAINKYGTCCTGSRFLNGTLDLHEELESELAKWLGKEAVLVFGTGVLANMGVIPALVGRNDVVITDAHAHASIIDGCRLSFGEHFKYRHNDMDNLQKVLSKLDNSSGKLIITDGVFSMGGDVADLPGLVDLAQKNSARLMIDDAHSVGVLGTNGKGTAEHFNLSDKIDIIMGTLSKSFASTGAYIASSERVINYVKHFARTLIFSISIPPASTAVSLRALQIIKNEPERRERLWEITKFMLKGFHDLGFEIGMSNTPIIPVIIGDIDRTFMFAKLLFENGIYANPVISPAVPADKCLIRTSYMATHTNEHLEKVLEIFKKVGRQLGII